MSTVELPELVLLNSSHHKRPLAQVTLSLLADWKGAFSSFISFSSFPLYLHNCF